MNHIFISLVPRQLQNLLTDDQGNRSDEKNQKNQEEKREIFR